MVYYTDRPCPPTHKSDSDNTIAQTMRPMLLIMVSMLNVMRHTYLPDGNITEL
jgi:hypothetical protein